MRELPVSWPSTGSDFWNGKLLMSVMNFYGANFLSVCSILDRPICGLFVTLMVEDIQFYFGTRTKL